MKDVIEELKALRNSESKEIPKLSDLETIAKSFSHEDDEFLLRRQAMFKRMLPDYYATFSYDGVPSVKSLMEETLFYIFYTLIDSDLQIQAYNELINKGYNFSKTLDLFVHISDMKIADDQSHNIIVFIPWEWKKGTRSVVFTSEFINGLESYVSAE